MVRDARGTRSRIFPRTTHLVENGDSCRVYGSMSVKKVTGNLHIVRSLSFFYFHLEQNLTDIVDFLFSLI